jgi:hypothetical protein
MTCYSPLLRKTVEAVVLPCAHCQHYKNVQRGHGATAPREADILPWNQVAVDTIGPWVLKVQNRQERFYALTIIDMVTNLAEIVRLQNRTSAHAATVFINTWLARYPKPISCTMIRVVSLSDGHSSACYNSATLNIALLLLKIPKRTLYANICIKQ